LCGFNHLAHQGSDHDIDTDLKALLKQAFGPVNKPDVGRLPQPDFFILAVSHPTHGKSIPFDDIDKYNMVQICHCQAKQRSNSIKTQLFKLGDKK